MMENNVLSNKNRRNRFQLLNSLGRYCCSDDRVLSSTTNIVPMMDPVSSRAKGVSVGSAVSLPRTDSHEYSPCSGYIHVLKGSPERSLFSPIPATPSGLFRAKRLVGTLSPVGASPTAPAPRQKLQQGQRRNHL